MKRGGCFRVTQAVLLLISFPALMNCANETSNATSNATSTQSSSSRHNVSSVEVPKERGPTKDRLGKQVCENLAAITNREMKGLRPVQTTSNAAFSQELACAIEPGYRCFPTSDAEYDNLKIFYEKGYEIPPAFTPDLKENFCMSGKCNSSTQTCTECMKGARVIKCPFFKPQRDNGGFCSRRPSTWLLPLLVSIAMLVKSLVIPTSWRNWSEHS